MRRIGNRLAPPRFLLFLAVLIGSLITSGGTANWYKGVQLLAVYVMIGLLLYFVPL